MSKTILVVGGAGYIGSHMVKQLSQAGYLVVVLDNLSTSGMKSIPYGELVVGDLADSELLHEIFSYYKFDGVMHFAANSLVGESVKEPAKYYRNNVASTINLLDAMAFHGVKNFIFSSTAAIFGEPEYTPIDEVHPKKPINPYGSSKLMVERLLEDYASAYGVNSVSLRYFNACGADPEGELGENHEPETHLIPLVLQAASGRSEFVTIFGRDYPTEDGTCVRDYIHVYDICKAHDLALEALQNKKLKGAQVFNLGNGSGFSVQQVIDAVREVVAKEGRTFYVEEGARRLGDPAVLVADATCAHKTLGWKPIYTDLRSIVLHAWAWEKKLVNIY